MVEISSGCPKPTSFTRKAVWSVKHRIFQSQGLTAMCLLDDQLCLSMQESPDCSLCNIAYCLPLVPFDLEFPNVLNITTVLFFLFLKHLSSSSGSTFGFYQIKVGLPRIVSLPFHCDLSCSNSFNDYPCEDDLQKGTFLSLVSVYHLPLSVLFQSSAQSSNWLVIKPMLSACQPDQVTLIVTSAPNLTSLPFILKMSPNIELQRQEILDPSVSFTPLSSNSVHLTFARCLTSILVSLFPLYYHHCGSGLILNLGWKIDPVGWKYFHPSLGN